MYLTPAQVAERFAVSPRTVIDSWANTGKLPAYKVGGSVRFLIHDVDNFVRPRPTRTQPVVPPHDRYPAQQAS